MADVRFGFRTDPDFEEKLQASPEYQKVLWDKAEEAAEYARAIAPYKTGEYHDSIHVREGLHGPGPELAATDHKAWWIEYGTGPGRPQGGSSPEFATLRRAVRAVGLELGPDAEEPPD
jgi:hypothetical protein